MIMMSIGGGSVRRGSSSVERDALALPGRYIVRAVQTDIWEQGDVNGALKLIPAVMTCRSHRVVADTKKNDERHGTEPARLPVALRAPSSRAEPHTIIG